MNWKVIRKCITKCLMLWCEFELLLTITFKICSMYAATKGLKLVHWISEDFSEVLILPLSLSLCLFVIWIAIDCIISNTDKNKEKDKKVVKTKKKRK